MLINCDSHPNESKEKETSMQYKTKLDSNLTLFFKVNQIMNKIKIYLFLISGMIGYGMAKAAVHQLVKSLAQDKGGLPEGAFVSAILP